MTYRINGRQYIVVGVSGGNYTGEYIAFALPQSEIRTATAQVGSKPEHRSMARTGLIVPVLFFLFYTF